MGVEFNCCKNDICVHHYESYHIAGPVGQITILGNKNTLQKYYRVCRDVLYVISLPLAHYKKITCTFLGNQEPFFSNVTIAYGYQQTDFKYRGHIGVFSGRLHRLRLIFKNCASIDAPTMYTLQFKIEIQKKTAFFAKIHFRVANTIDSL